MNVKEFLNPEQEASVILAIKNAEKQTSGEIRVHLESKTKKPVLDRAAEVFKKLSMHKTEARNGVLFYVAVEDKTFAIIGDEGINQKVPTDFWEETKNVLVSHFKTNDFGVGLAKGIAKAGEQLQAHFPYQKDDVNELPDDISFGE